MKTEKTRKVLIAFLAALILTSILLAPTAKAFPFSFTDSASVDVSVTSSSDIVKSGDTVTFTVALTLNTFLNGNAHVRIWLNNSAQLAVNLINNDIMASRNWTAGSSFNQPYAVAIPNDAANNNYILATIDVGAKHFSNLVVALVQNPTYFELQTQILQYQSNVTNLAAQVATLQTQLNTAKANSTSLQTQLTNLTSTYNALLDSYNSLSSNSSSNKAALLSQISVLEGQLNNLNSSNSALQTQLFNVQAENTILQSQLNNAQTDNATLSLQVAILEGNNTLLQSQLNSLQTEKIDLVNQTSVLQEQVTRLQFNNTNLQTMVNNLSNSTSTLRTQLSDLQSKFNTNSILLYLATFVSIAFIIATAYIIIIVVKPKSKKTEEAPLY